MLEYVFNGITVVYEAILLAGVIKAFSRPDTPIRDLIEKNKNEFMYGKGNKC